jgi:hypothetical protein
MICLTGSGGMSSSEYSPSLKSETAGISVFPDNEACSTFRRGGRAGRGKDADLRHGRIPFAPFCEFFRNQFGVPICIHCSEDFVHLLGGVEDGTS